MRPRPGPLTICIACSIHFSVSSADTEYAPSVAAVDPAFASIPHPGRLAQLQRPRGNRSTSYGTRRMRAVVSGGIEWWGTRERILDGPGRPGPVSCSGNRKGQLPSSSPRPLPAPVTVSAESGLCDFWRAPSRTRPSSPVVRARRQRKGFLVDHHPFPLDSPHPGGLKMLRSTWNFLKRHKKKCIFLGTVLGGGWQRSWQGALEEGGGRGVSVF